MQSGERASSQAAEPRHGVQSGNGGAHPVAQLCVVVDLDHCLQVVREGQELLLRLRSRGDGKARGAVPRRETQFVRSLHEVRLVAGLTRCWCRGGVPTAAHAGAGGSPTPLTTAGEYCFPYSVLNCSNILVRNRLDACRAGGSGAAGRHLSAAPPSGEGHNARTRPGRACAQAHLGAPPAELCTPPAASPQPGTEPRCSASCPLSHGPPVPSRPVPSRPVPPCTHVVRISQASLSPSWP